jgi:hypothetical protein
MPPNIVRSIGANGFVEIKYELGFIGVALLYQFNHYLMGHL